MHLYRSNRLERLADLFARVIHTAGGDPLAADVVIVQSEGMGQWLSLAVADRVGIAAGMDFVRPRPFLEGALGAVLGRSSLRLDAVDRERMTWALLELLPTWIDAPGFEAVRGWLREVTRGPAEGALLQLAQRLAGVYDQVLVYRPDWVLAWEAGERAPVDAGSATDEAWQGKLWRALMARLTEVGEPPTHVARLAAEATARLRAGEGAVGLPERVMVFGVTTLPPLYLSLLDALERHGGVAVHLFALDASREFFADVRRDRAGDGGDAARPPTPALLETFGQVAREMQDMVTELDPVDRLGDALFQVPEGDALLRRVQADLLDLDVPAGRAPLADDDDSVVIYGCHTPMREVEVVLDHLRGMLEADPTLSPRDILISTPDLSVHGPLLEAALQREPWDPAYLPWHMSDRPVTGSNGVAAALVAVLGLRGGRCAAAEIVDVLDVPALRARFGLEGLGRSAMARWVEAARVTWGRDPAHRASVGLASPSRATWEHGLDRLLLGLVAAPDELVGGHLPVAELEGDAARDVASVAAAVHAIFDFLAHAGAPGSADAPRRAVAAWTAWLGAEVGDWCAGDAAREQEAVLVRERLAAIARAAAAAGFSGEVPFDVVQAELLAALSEERSFGGFLRGGVTVCELLPMRAIPFRVVALLGWTEGVFPRNDVAAGFDLVARARKRGDRSRRGDDRAMVLEALLSARDALIITGVAFSARRGEPLARSVALEELLDGLVPHAALGDGPDDPARARLERRLVREAPLQPFSTRYVAPTPPEERWTPVTWDVGAHEGAAQLWRGGAAPAVRRWELDSSPDPEELPIDELVAFLSDPPLWFLQRRLGVAIDREEAPLPERDTLWGGAAEAWGWREAWIRARMAGRSPAEAERRLVASGLLLQGGLRGVQAESLRAAEAIVEAAEPWRSLPARPDPVVSVDVAGTRIVGRVTGARGAEGDAGTLLEVSASRGDGAGARYAVGAWARWLVLQVASTQPWREAVWVGRGAGSPAVVRRLPDPDARRRVEAVVALWRAARRAPLRALPAPAEAWLRAEPEVAWKRADQALTAYLRGRATSSFAWETLLGSPTVRPGDDLRAYAEGVAPAWEVAS
jgi:exodeoxyribonuclease V gamma subunit